MNEILLLAAAIVLIIILSTVITRIKNPQRFYIRMVAGILLLTFIWFSKEMKIAVSAILSAIVIYGLYKEYLSFKTDTVLKSNNGGTGENI